MAKITESSNLRGSFFVSLSDDSEIALLQTNDLINLICDIKSALVASGRSAEWVNAVTSPAPFLPAERI